MSLDSLHFLVFVALTLLAFTYSPTIFIRKLIFSLATGYFFCSYFLNDLLGAAILFIVLLTVYAVIIRLSTVKNVWLLGTTVTILVLLFPAILYSNQIFIALSVGKKAVTILGYAYILLKLIHMLTDSYQGVLIKLPLWDFIVYNLNFLTLIAGPIQRFSDFQIEWNTLGNGHISLQDSYTHLNRVANGYVQMVLLSPLVRLIPNWLSEFGLQSDTFVELSAFYLRPVYLYLNFAGYTSVVIGIGLLFGFKLPENFNKPWLATDFLDVWQRWHITLTHWMRDYVFTPLYKLLLIRFIKRQTLLAIMLYFVTFFIQGLWHRVTPEFMVYALVLALGAALTKIVQVVLANRLGKKDAKVFMKSQQFKIPYFVLNYHIFASSTFLIKEFL